MSQLLPVSEWPCFRDGGHYLCVVRGHAEERQHGFVLEGSWDVNLGYVWDGGTGDVVSYDSAEALLADGWSVD